MPKKVVVEDIFYVMDFGKHTGLTVGEVFECDPSYLLWAHETTTRFKLCPSMLEQLRDHLSRINKAKYKVAKAKGNFMFPPEGTMIKFLDDDIPFA